MIRRMSIVLLTCGLLLIISCTGKKTSENIKYVQLGNDSLTVTALQKLIPEQVSDSIKLQKAMLRTVLAGAKSVKNFTGKDSIYVKLSEKLSLISGTDWSPEAASALMNAAETLCIKARELKNGKAIASHIDSLFSSTVRNSGSLVLPFVKDSLYTATSVDNKTVVFLIATVFQIRKNEATLVLDFINSRTTGGAKGKDVSEIVKGLVYDKKAEKQKSTAVAEPKVERDNSVMALKYRNQQSIHDSIDKHIPELQAVYKKNLKKHENMSGQIWVVFRIDASGKVSTVKIKSSEIREQDFVSPFSDYLKTIRFKEIPAKVGYMTFEFPFEFKSEM